MRFTDAQGRETRSLVTHQQQSQSNPRGPGATHADAVNRTAAADAEATLRTLGAIAPDSEDREEAGYTLSEGSSQTVFNVAAAAAKLIAGGEKNHNRSKVSICVSSN